MNMLCRWCGQPLHLAPHDEWLTEDGELCTPELREESCRLWFYRNVFGIDPLQLLNHDDMCPCQRTIIHLPTQRRGEMTV